MFVPFFPPFPPRARLFSVEQRKRALMRGRQLGVGGMGGKKGTRTEQQINNRFQFTNDGLGGDDVGGRQRRSGTTGHW